MSGVTCALNRHFLEHQDSTVFRNVTLARSHCASLNTLSTSQGAPRQHLVSDLMGPYQDRLPKTGPLFPFQYENTNISASFMDSGRPPRPTCRDDFEIAIICALPLEYDAVVDAFDGFWNDDGDPYGKVVGDQNTYTTGWIGQHNVVLVVCSDVGKVNATSVATSCSMSFTQIKLAFLVGICGVAPRTTDRNEILLGDVIIGDQIVAYDFGKRYADELKLKSSLTFKTTDKSHSVRRFMNTMQTDHYRELLLRRATDHLQTVRDRYSSKYGSPQRSEDRLFTPEYRHKHHKPRTCPICDECTTTSKSVCEVALASICEDLGCDSDQLIPRQRLANGDVPQSPVLHWGVFASADTVLKSARDRDWIAEKYGVIAFEMEATGACDIFPCIVIKGACDYADSHKNKKWQNYAAISAACVMKSLLNWYPRTNQQRDSHIRRMTGRKRQFGEFASDAMHAHAMIQYLQQQNKSLSICIADLKTQLQKEKDLPPQVPFNDLVTVNDALGATYTFPLSFVDSLEFFKVLMKHKFQGVGRGKIERGEWLLQNHRTGYVLDLKKPWKAMIKPGQMLDMSMIFKKAHTVSTTCPWCDHHNEMSLDKRGTRCEDVVRIVQAIIVVLKKCMI
uniref:5'-methylthioadenosine/S-adenosylhomocysteine nucleosidase n=1 Tax=Talaromyces marneffei PM1 TaxID=1077442 RepID=A0A093XA57_TALMA